MATVLLLRKKNHIPSSTIPERSQVLVFRLKVLSLLSPCFHIWYLLQFKYCFTYSGNDWRGLISSSKYDLDEITEFSKISTVSSIWSNNPITRCMHHNGIPLLCNVVLRRSRVSHLPYNLRWNLHWMSQFFFCQTQTKKKSKFDMIEFAISYDRNA